jgi:hypothetical protein
MELVKRSASDESTWVVTHLYMESMLGISLYNHPYLNQQKRFLFLLLLMSSTKLEVRAKQILPGSKEVWGERKGTQWLK